MQYRYAKFIATRYLQSEGERNVRATPNINKTQEKIMTDENKGGGSSGGSTGNTGTKGGGTGNSGTGSGDKK